MGDTIIDENATPISRGCVVVEKSAIFHDCFRCVSKVHGTSDTSTVVLKDAILEDDPFVVAWSLAVAKSVQFHSYRAALFIPSNIINEMAVP